MVRNWTANHGDQATELAAVARCPASQPSQPVGNPASAPPFLRSSTRPRPARGQAVAWPAPAQCLPAGLADRRISPRAQQPFRGRRPKGGWEARESAKLSWEVCVPTEIDAWNGAVTRKSRGCGCRREAFAAPPAMGAWATASSLTLVSHPKQGKPPRCAGKPQCRLAAFRPSSSSEHRRCYTSRTLSVWSPRILALAGLKWSKSFLCHHSRSAVDCLCLGFFPSFHFHHLISCYCYVSS